ncbi:hypothetical protein PMAYCL1PPCAC_10934, partial [Pristionchus mayeri]
TLLSFCAFQVAQAKIHHVNVSGTIVCDTERMTNALVELWERDVPPVDPHDLLALVRSDPQGEFVLRGSTDELSLPEFFLRVTHTCGAKENCTLIGEVPIADKYVDNEFEMGFLELNGLQQEEKCEHN